MKVTGSFLLGLILSCTVWASEGFFDIRNDLSYDLRNAWDSTLFVSPIDQGMLGAGFVVAKSTDQNEIYILTSGHVIESICGESKGKCPNLLISDHQVWHTGKKFDVVVNKNGATSFDAEVVRLSKNPDLALVKVVGEKKWSHLQPVPPAKNCKIREKEPVVLIGHPVLITRTKWKLPAPPFPELTIKRWSRGLLIKKPFQSTKFDPGGSIWTATTADALEGNSGGPALNREGEYVGSLDVLAKSDGMPYDGFQGAEPMQWHSLLIRCEDIQSFVETGLEVLKLSM